MKTPITPKIVRDRAKAAHVTMQSLFDRAGVQASTFWRWERGHTTKLNPVSEQKLMDALAGAEAERVAA